MKAVFISFFATMFASSITPLFSEVLVNRRVLIVNFVNQKKVSDADYLSVTIPESLVEALTATKSFIILPRDKAAESAKKLNIADAQLFSDQSAENLGRDGAADVVVIGNYVVVENTIQIQTKAIDVETGRVKASKSTVGKVDGSIFETIRRLASSMSDEMKQNLPPIPQREIIRETKGNEPPEEKKRGSWYWGFGAGTNILLPDVNLGVGSLSTDPGISAMGLFGKTLAERFLVGLTTVGSLSYANKSYTISGSGVGPNSGGSGGSIPFTVSSFDNFITLGYFPFSNGFNVRAGGGISWLQFTTSNTSVTTAAAAGVTNTSGTNIGFSGLVQTGYSFWLGKSFNLGINAGVIFAGSGYGSAHRLMLFVTCEWF